MPVLTETTSLWFNGQNTNPGALLRLFCFPYAGGGSLIYRQWTRRLPSTIEVVRAQLPGREGRLKEPPFTRLELLITELVEAIRPLLDKPFAFFGHSMGGLISFELARRVQKEYGVLPAHLFLSAYPAPHVPDAFSVIYDLPEPEFLEEVRRLNGTPNEVLEHPELMRLVLPLIRADFELCQTYDYAPGPPLYCPLSIFGGLEDKEAGHEKLEAWRQYTTGPFMLHMLPGDHFFVNSSQSLLLQLVARNLENSCRKEVQL
jgi:medium-chain acyl-[acyl-carrier-protein] hydrolase